MPNHILSPTNAGIPRRRIFLLALSIIAYGFYLCSISDSRPESGVYDRLRFGRHIDFEQVPVAKSQALPIGSNASVAMAEFPPPPPAVEFPSPLNGAPTIAFQDNLQPDVNYITAWPGASFTNDLMLYTNLIYLGLITERVPVIPAFTPMHISEGEDSKGPSAGPILNFGDIFDIPRLQRAIRAPVLDWRQVKDPRSQSIDDLGCWNIWGTVNSSKVPHWTVAHERLKLDISYTIVPKWVKLVPGNNIDRHVSFWSLAALSYNTTRFENPSPPSRSPKHGVSLPPDKHLLCFDNLYWVGAKWPHEWNEEISPAWRFVGRHIYWTPKIRELANTYVRTALRVPPHEPTPQYITVHARNGGFGERCKVPLEECFTPLSAIAQGVEEVKAELLATKGITVDAVIVTSDEKNRTWWDAVARQGWLRPDHSRTVERHGLWYPMLIDAAIQAASIGFVGTEDSTVSLLAAKRVKAWYDGSTRSVGSVRLHSADH